MIRSGINIAGKKHGPHSLRASLASSMVNDGISYETVRKVLGHYSLNAHLYAKAKAKKPSVLAKLRKYQEEDMMNALSEMRKELSTEEAEL